MPGCHALSLKPLVTSKDEKGFQKGQTSVLASVSWATFPRKKMGTKKFWRLLKDMLVRFDHLPKNWKNKCLRLHWNHHLIYIIYAYNNKDWFYAATIASVSSIANWKNKYGIRRIHQGFKATSVDPVVAGRLNLWTDHFNIQNKVTWNFQAPKSTCNFLYPRSSFWRNANSSSELAVLKACEIVHVTKKIWNRPLKSWLVK